MTNFGWIKERYSREYRAACKGKANIQAKNVILTRLVYHTCLPLFLFISEFPVFPDHFSLRSESSTSLSCVAIDQPGDKEWRVKYLCYKPALKKMTIAWSRSGTIVGQQCTNTRMPNEGAAAVWENSFLCVPQDSFLKFSWSVSGRIRGKECVEMRKTRRNIRGYFLCGTSKFQKIGGLNNVTS